MSFFWFHRKFYEDFNAIHRVFVDTARPAHHKLREFEEIVIRQKAQHWNWGKYYELVGKTNKFEKEVRARIPNDQKEWLDDVDDYEYIQRSYEQDRWRTSNWNFLTQAQTLEWNVDLNEMMDGWDDWYSTKDCVEVTDRLWRSIDAKMSEHDKNITRATFFGGLLELLGAICTSEGMLRIFKQTSRGKLAIVSLLGYPASVVCSNVAIALTAGRITADDL